MVTDSEDIYAVKRSTFLGKPVTYICQNINGPCPLLAIANVLLLRGHISIDSRLQSGVIAASDLLQIVMKRLVDANPPLPESDELGRLTQQKTLQDVKEILPSLLVGLDVNVRFHSITDFEYTVACAVFDMLDLALVHGWLLDIQDVKAVQVIQNKSYNELIERLVDYRGILLTENAASAAGATGSDANEAEEKPASVPCEATEEASGDSATEDIATRETTSLLLDMAIVDAAATSPCGGSGAEPLPSASSTVMSPKSPSQRTVEVLKRERQLSDAVATDTATTILDEGPVLEEFFATSASQLTYYGLVKLHEDLRERQLAVFFRNNHFSTLFKVDGALFLLVTDAGYLDEPTVVWEKLNEIDGDTEYLDANFRPLNANETRQQTIIQQQEDARRRLLENPAPTPTATPTPTPTPMSLAPTEQIQEQHLEQDQDQAPTSESSNTNIDDDRTRSQGNDEELHNSEQDPDYLLALQFQKEEEEERARVIAQMQMQSQSQATPPSSSSADIHSINTGGTRVSLRPLGAARYVEREPSEDRSDSEPPSSSQEGEATFAVNANGDLVLSDAELQAQQNAELYYRQQRELQQQSQSGGGGGGSYVGPSQPYYNHQPQPPTTRYQPNRAAAPSRNEARRDSNDCLLM